MEVKVHAARLTDEGQETARGILFRDVDALCGNYIEVLALTLKYTAECDRDPVPVAY